MAHTLSRLFLSAAVAAVLGSFGGLAQAVDYVAIDLHPSGFASSQAYGVAGSQQVGSGVINGTPHSFNHALLWNGSASNYIDLHPADCLGFSQAYGTSGSQQVGSAGAQAILWNGSADNYVILHTSEYGDSSAWATDGVQQVGDGLSLSTWSYHALLWSGTAASTVDLNPSGFYGSSARAVSGGQQVGIGQINIVGTSIMTEHALLWYGTAASAVDLHPTGFITSSAQGVCGAQQVGFGAIKDSPYHTHALLWNGTAASAVDLNPTGYTWSRALGTNGLQQVGQAGGHAFLWNGSANNYVDLHQFLPSGYSDSCATSIDAQGNIVGYAYTGDIQHAMMWSPVPEPSAFVLLGVGTVGLIVCRLRRRAG
jgi:hypothetical protein